MSQPDMVKAIEEAFVPLLVINNTGGEDRKILKQFNEPAWNYQVIRFIDEKGKDIIPRKDRVWSLPALAKRMELTLKKHDQPIPQSLQKLL